MKAITQAINELEQILTNQAASSEELSATVVQVSLNSEVLVEHVKKEYCKVNSCCRN